MCFQLTSLQLSGFPKLVAPGHSVRNSRTDDQQFQKQLQDQLESTQHEERHPFRNNMK